MKIFKSIKWRLQIWYGLILVLVLAGFGFVAYHLEVNLLIQRLEDEANRRFDVLARALHPPPPNLPAAQPPFAGPPPNDFAPRSQPGPDARAPREFHLPPQAEDLFGTNSPNNFYFIVADRDGNEIARSANAPLNEVRFEQWFANNSRGLDSAGYVPLPSKLNQFKDNRTAVRRLPSGETVFVGCSIAPELKELHRTALKLAGFGGIILFFGLAGGWWIVSRSLRPVVGISSTAIKISAGDLSQRINAAETESELGELAAVLNSTFARLEAAFAQQKQFASDAAHELRTPVSVILTQTQTALNREREAADYKQTLEACQRAAQRMRKLVGALLELARLDAGQEQMKRLQFDLAQTARDCVELVRPLADERGVKFSTELAPLEITGDPERLAQVLINLLTNAVQYNNENGEAKISVKSENGMAVFTVSDNGAGIPAEDLSRVFERFYRADKSRSSGNAGLGLAISKAIVEAHGGTVEVTSEMDKGTTLIVRLPLA
ncbi:MAG TPA: ATP-binding protein [Candidatus Aquilonibacter sp.]|nr:ATP-binding protein [Candidatus Aquilonibacter sp.]